VFVRAGTSVADVEPPPLPRMALPSRPAPPLSGAADVLTHARSASVDEINERGLDRYLRLARAHPALWMVLAPVVLASVIIGVAIALTPARTAKPSGNSAPAAALTEPASPKSAPAIEQRQASLAELEARPPESLSAKELIRVAEGRADRKLNDARALGEKLDREPTLATDKATQAELLRLARDSETSRVALAALARLGTPLGADLLYEVWTGTAVRTDATELARALVNSQDVRQHASPALAVALDLRGAESCEAVKAVLPRALKDGDRRSLSQLGKLVNRRGCGPKKNEDCYACLREKPDELTATLNAAKSRRPPAF
jgi:hypothetical protein